MCDVKFFVPNKKNINMLNDTPDACLDFVNSLLLLVTTKESDSAVNYCYLIPSSSRK